MSELFKHPPLLVAIFAIALSSCQPSPKFQQQVAVPSQAWEYSFKPSFKFEVLDTAAAYQLFFLVKHTDDYLYNNIWVNISVKAPGDTVFNTPTRVEIPLAEQAGINAGKWLGRGTGSIYEQRMPLSNARYPTYFPKAGEYTIQLSQDMRVSPLPGILQVGLRVDKDIVTMSQSSETLPTPK